MLTCMAWPPVLYSMNSRNNTRIADDQVVWTRPYNISIFQEQLVIFDVLSSAKLPMQPKAGIRARGWGQDSSQEGGGATSGRQ
jgi:hypothetical protein